MDRASLERAFATHRRRVDAVFAAGDFAGYADEFTLDATYSRPGRPLIEGHEGIRRWAAETMNTWPATEIAALDVVWHSVDPSRDAVIYEVRTTMRDPGDGSILSASTTTSLFSDGAGLWRACIDVTNPRAYEDMFATWLRLAARHGLVPLSAREHVAAEEPGRRDVGSRSPDRSDLRGPVVSTRRRRAPR